MRGQSPSERGAGQLLMEGRGGKAGREGGGEEEEGEGKGKLKHHPACVTQEFPKQEQRGRKKEEINKK